jgi:hypothetical protein
MPSVTAFLFLNVCAAAIAALAARAAFRGAGVARHALAVLGGFLVLVHTVVLATGLPGRLSAGTLAVLLGAALAVVAWRTRRSPPMEERVDGAARFTPATLALPAAAVVTSGVWAWPHVTGATRLWIWDDYTYHMVYPALWLREHAIAAVTPEHAFTMQAWYPLSASVVATWFMAPFAGARGEALAWVSLTGVLYAAIIATGAAELLGRLGCRRGAWAVPLVLFATSQRIGVMASSFSDADLAHAATLFAALVFATPRASTETPREVWTDGWYAAVLSGLAIGIKVSAAPAAVIVLLMMAWRLSTRRQAARIALLFFAAWTVTGAYWYLRNIVHTGNPLYPAAFLGAPGTTFPHTTLREYAREYGVARTVSDALVVYLNWPLVHAGLAIVGLAGLAAWLAVRRRALSRPRAFFASGALVITVVTLVLLPSTPDSAGNGMTFVSGFIHWDSMRYVALLPILGWVALGALVDAGAGAPLWRALVAGVVTIAALLASPLDWSEVALVVVGAVMIVALARPATAFVTEQPRRICVAMGLVLAIALALVALSHSAKAGATAASIHREPLFGAAAAVLDRQTPGTRIAVYGDQWIYPMFGAGHHLVPVRLDSEGQIATTPIGDGMTPGPLNVHPFRFRANLAAARIGLVAVVHLPHPGRSPEWPSQAKALEAVGGVRLIYRDRAVGIWRVE